MLPTPAFFYGLRPDEEITRDIEPGKTLIIRFLTIGEAASRRHAHAIFRIERPAARNPRARPRAESRRAQRIPRPIPPMPGHVAAPTSGVITGISVQVNQSVQRGEKLMTLEAMKMQSNIYAPVAGRVTKILVAANQNVEAKDLLATISTAS